MDEMIETLGLWGGPMFDIVSAIKTGVDPFTDKPISGEKPNGSKIADWLMYAYDMNAPPFLTRRGWAGQTIGAASGDVQTWGPARGEPGLTVAQAMARLAGVNLYPVDPEMTAQANVVRMAGKVRELVGNLKRELSNPNYSDQKKAEIRAEYMTEIEARQLQIAEYRQQTQIPEKLKVRRAR
jgi:hypothetical protein